jgi:hypothetical protein
MDATLRPQADEQIAWNSGVTGYSSMTDLADIYKFAKNEGIRAYSWDKGG